MTDTLILPDGRGITYGTSIFADGTFLTEFSVYNPDGSAQAIGLPLEAPTEGGRLSVMAIQSADGGGGIKVFFHEENFVQFDDGTIFATTFAPGLAETETVSEMGHLFPQTGPSLLTLEDGRLIYGSSNLDAPSPIDFSLDRLFPSSFFIRVDPYSQDIAETAEGGVIWATMSRTEPFDTTPVQLHVFDAAFDPIETGVELGSDRHRPNQSDAASGIEAVSIATLADGGYAVAWTTERFADSSRTGTPENGVFLSILNADLSTRTPEIRLDAPGVQVQEKPQVYALDDGGFAVAWQNRQQGNSALNNDLVIQTFEGDGTLVAEEVVPRGIGDPLQEVDTEDLVISGDGTTFFMGPDTATLLDARPAAGPGDGGGNGPTGPTEGPDEISGDGLLEGLGGDDTLSGGTGDDTLDGGSGDDILRGGAGSDVYLVDGRGDTVVEAAGDPGFDEIRTTSTYRLEGPGIEQLTAIGSGNVRLEGSTGAEILVGNDGNNILVGFGGADTMTGGAGDDFFVLTGRAGTAPDVLIADFAPGDIIAIDDQLLGIGGAAIDPRPLTQDVLRDLLAQGTVSYRAGSGELKIDLDGDGTRELVATLEGGARLGLDDVLLF